jgi:predicted DNA-binding transcriptional regulator YafY
MTTVKFTYRNHAGKIEDREVEPISIGWQIEPRHPYQPGWFLVAYDPSRKANRSFALSSIILPKGDDGITDNFTLWGNTMRAGPSDG